MADEAYSFVYQEDIEKKSSGRGSGRTLEKSGRREWIAGTVKTGMDCEKIDVNGRTVGGSPLTGWIYMF